METRFQQLMKESDLSENGLIFSDERKTTVKTRVISEGKHQLRIDEEDTKPLQIEDEFLQNVLEIIDSCEVLILQDYNKGVLTKKIISDLISSPNKRGIPIIVDPKKIIS